MYSWDMVELIEETKQRILMEGKIKDPKVAHEIALRWVKGIAG